MKLRKKEIRNIVKAALKEDVFRADITSKAVEFKAGTAQAEITAKQEGVLCGTEIVQTVFREVSGNAGLEVLKQDGDTLEPGTIVMKINGRPEDLLAAERTALNFLSHLSGIASLVSEFVHRVKSANPKCSVLDTRKTLPGLRFLEKYAVRVGGGENHRMNLSDQVLVKENHLILAEKGIKELVKDIRKKVPDKILEVEVENIHQLEEVLECGADIIMLDNFKIQDIIEGVKTARSRDHRVKIEVSGGMNLDTAQEAARAGVDRISIGRLTNSAPALDFSMRIKG